MASEGVIENLKRAKVDFEDNEEEGTMTSIHVRCQQRSGRKMITTVEGISAIYSKHRIVKKMKKFFFCNGNVNCEEEYGEVIQLQGDQRLKVQKFLLDFGLAKDYQIVVHGY